MAAVKTHTAACSCGQLSVSVEGEPIRISVCHCHSCQRRTGSAFGVQARFPADRVAIRGNATEYRRVGDSGNEIAFHFCPQCGSTVFYRLSAIPDVVAVAVGAFADEAFPPPRVSVYEARRHPWVTLPHDLERHD